MRGTEITGKEETHTGSVISSVRNTNGKRLARMSASGRRSNGNRNGKGLMAVAGTMGSQVMAGIAVISSLPS
jgi:hypothetical protein